MAGYCTSVRPYFHEPQASENTAQLVIFSGIALYYGDTYIISHDRQVSEPCTHGKLTQGEAINISDQINETNAVSVRKGSAQSLNVCGPIAQKIVGQHENDRQVIEW